MGQDLFIDAVPFVQVGVEGVLEQGVGLAKRPGMCVEFGQLAEFPDLGAGPHHDAGRRLVHDRSVDLAGLDEGGERARIGVSGTGARSASG